MKERTIGVIRVARKTGRIRGCCGLPFETLNLVSGSLILNPRSLNVEPLALDRHPELHDIFFDVTG